MPVYSVCFTKSTTWNVYAKSKEEAEEAAKLDEAAQEDAMDYSEMTISVYNERLLKESTTVHAVVNNGELLADCDVPWFSAKELAEKENKGG